MKKCPMPLLAPRPIANVVPWEGRELEITAERAERSEKFSLGRPVSLPSAASTPAAGARGAPPEGRRRRPDFGIERVSVRLTYM